MHTATTDLSISPVLQIKRIFDIVVATLLLVLSAPLFPLIALAIKLSSPGPVFFKQLRTGMWTPTKTHLFWMLKFRSMVMDAELKSGAVWAQKNDPRMTAVGQFLRKTRLDELPQLINVLRGEMSLVGPRPERPEFYNRLEEQIPFFVERTYGVLPGITGLAQVNQGYDTCIDDVRSKLGYDLSYSLSLNSIWRWLKMDISVIWRTVVVMVTGRGQ